MKKVMTDIRKNLEDAKELLIYAENVALSPEGPAVYEATLEKDLRVIEEFDPDPFMDMLNQYGLPWIVDENPQTVE